MTKLHDELGPKGLNVLAITHEPREQVLKMMAQMPPAEVTFTIGLQGSSGLNNPTGGIPYSWLISADGIVVWQGSGTPAEKVINEELKKVNLTADQKAAKATKGLEYAEMLITTKQLTRAIEHLDRMAKAYKGTDFAKKAEDRKKALEADESLKAELAAQKALASITDGAELPKEKMKQKERDAKKVQLEKFILKNKETAPVAAEQAGMWVKVMAERWEDGAK